MSGNRFLLTTVLFFCGVAIAASQSIDSTGKVKGRVSTASDDIPLATAFAYFHDANGEENANLNGRVGDVKAKVDSNGQFEVRLSSADYDVFVASAGYLPECRVIHVDSGTTSELNIKLKLDLAHGTDRSGSVTIVPIK